MVLSVQSTHSPALESCPSTYTSKPPLQMVLAMMYVPEVSVFERPVVLDLPQSLKAKENAVSSWLLQVAVSAADAETAIQEKAITTAASVAANFLIPISVPSFLFLLGGHLVIASYHLHSDLKIFFAPIRLFCVLNC